MSPRGNSAAEISIKGSSPYKIVWTILNMDKRGTQTNGPKNKETDDDAQSLTSERWYRQKYVSRKERSRRHTRIENCVDKTIQGRKEYNKKCLERLITGVGDSNDNIRVNKKTKKSNKN